MDFKSLGFDLTDIFLNGEIFFEDGRIFYIYETDITNDNAADDLWDSFCDDMSAIRERYPNLEYKESWADNDSTGCEIVNF